MTFRRLVGDTAEIEPSKSSSAQQSRDADVRQLRAALLIQEGDVLSLMTELRELQDRHQAQTAQLREVEMHARSLEAQLGNRDQALHALVNSFSWRCTASLRQGLRLSQRLITGCKTTALASYRYLPWPWHILFRIAPSLFRDTSSYQAWLRANQASRKEIAQAAISESTASQQDRCLGVDLQLDPAISIAIGIPMGNETDDHVRRTIVSARRCLERAGFARYGRIFVLASRSVVRDDLADITAILPGERQIGHAAAHNRLMAEAFARGASIYIAASPDGVFHPAAIPSLARMMRAHQDAALIEAVQFPSEAPKVYDPRTFETAWVSSTCMAIPRAIYERVGGFDETLHGRCADVDFSWRARVHGYALYTCPTARFFRSAAERANDTAAAELIKSAIVLAQKWGNSEFAASLNSTLETAGLEVSASDVTPVPMVWRWVANFRYGLEFAETRW